MLDSSTSTLRGVGLTRSQILVNSVNPTSAGHKIYADIIAYTMQQALAEELQGLMANANTNMMQAASVSEEDAGTVQTLLQQLQQQMPPAVSPLAADEVDHDPSCALDQGFPAAVSVSASMDWKWGTDGSLAGCPHDHCRVWGYR
jgi:hypothetical protein